MKTFYFIVSLANSTDKTVGLCVSDSNRAEALAQACIRLTNCGYDATQVQSVSEGQFWASKLPSAFMSPPVCPPLCVSPLNPV